MNERLKPNPELASQEMLHKISDTVTELLQSDDPRIAHYNSDDLSVAIAITTEGYPAPFRIVREKDEETGRGKNSITPLGTERDWHKIDAKHYDHRITSELPYGRRSGTLIGLELTETDDGTIESMAKIKGVDDEGFTIITTTPLNEGFAATLYQDLSRPDLRLYSKKHDIIVEDARDKHDRTYKVIPNRGLAKLGRSARAFWSE